MQRFSKSFLIVATLTYGITCWCADEAMAQAGLRDSLELLDRNKNGYIDPDEVTSLSRPYLERIANARRMSLDRPNRIDKLQEAARIYYAIKNGADDDRVRTSWDSELKGFRPRWDDPLVPEFGLPDVKFPYQQRDLDEADEQLERYDRDRDGYLSRYESGRARWSRRDPFNEDFNKDDRLSRLELAQRYARRRLLEDDRDELIQRVRRVGTGIRSSEAEDERERRERERRDWWRSGGDRFWLTAAILGRFDDNRNGRLEPEETTDIGIPIGAIDADQNGELSRDELFAYFKELQDQTGGQVEGLPGWFYELDSDRDKQVSLPEFATELTDARVAEFVALDANQDGLLSASEVLSSKSMMGGTFENRDAEMLPPRKTIVSEINIEEDFTIADLNLRLSLTHTNVDHLDGYLTGPDGTRIELFTAVGGRDDNFEETLFDDQAGTPIVKGRPPFKGSFQPEGLVKRQPGLGAFNGKTIQGVWQLTIRCSRSDRFGFLHHWSLIARPDEESLLNRPELAATVATTLASEGTSEGSTNGDTSGSPDSQRNEVRKPEYASVETSSRSRYSKAAAEFWTPERKAEMAKKLRKPSAEEWEKMSGDEKRQMIAERAKAIAEYKNALSKGGDQGKEGKDRGDFKDLKKGLLKSRQ